MVRVFTNGPGDQGTIPGRVILYIQLLLKRNRETNPNNKIYSYIVPGRNSMLKRYKNRETYLMQSIKWL